MSGVEQTECQTIVDIDNHIPEMDENAPEVAAEATAEPQAIKADETDAVTDRATSAEALAEISNTLADIWPNAAEEETGEHDAHDAEAAAVPSTAAVVIDTEAEPHNVKVLNEEAEHEACLPSCLQEGSISVPSSLRVKGVSMRRQSPQNDTAEPPTAPAADESIAQDNSITAKCEGELSTASVSGASKETTEEGKVESASDADTNSSDQGQQKTPSINSGTGVRTFHVLAVPPQDLFFVAPPACKPGQPLWIQGPHGPLQVQAPEDVKPGRRVTVRLAAPFQHEVVVPAGAKPGHTVAFKGENGEELQTVVPPGKRPGQVFHVAPPVTMLRIPEGAIPGDQLLFKVPVTRQAMNAPKVFKELATSVPPNMAPGQYFAAVINEVSTQAPDNAAINEVFNAVEAPDNEEVLEWV